MNVAHATQLDTKLLSVPSNTTLGSPRASSNRQRKVSAAALCSSYQSLHAQLLKLELPKVLQAGAAAEVKHCLNTLEN